MEQKYIILNQESFELVDIFECGQCFRWNKEDDGSYTGVVKNAVINVNKKNFETDNKKNGIKVPNASKEIKENQIIFKGVFAQESNENRELEENKKAQDFENLIKDYFDLKTNYTDIKNMLSNIDEYLKESTSFGSGIRILNQDLWECIISFIISANNNIPRIKKIIERLSKEYGNEIIWNKKTYYTFPTPESLSKASAQDLRNLGLGFRDVRVFNTTKMILNKEIDLDKIRKMETTAEMRDELLKLDGVGPKVADCILLFGLKRYDVFPIDVWVRRVMNDLYIHNENEEKVSKKEILKLANEKFSDISGLAQQYLFYWKRSG